MDRAGMWMLFVAFAAAAGCSDPSGDADTNAATESGSESAGTETETGDEPPAYEIELLDRECPFEIPDGRSANCYTLVVPLDREQPELATVELAVAVLHPAGEITRPPVVYLHGGPGGAAVEGSAPWFDRLPAVDGEFVLFDQRGSGLSTPSLDCPEVEAGWFSVFSTIGTPQDEIALLADANADCHTRLSQDIDLSKFNTEANADDADDLRRALGYDEWSLYGISYGTRLGLEILRRHGEHVDTAVLDSVYPPQVGGVDWMVASAEDALDRMVAGCLEEALCSMTFPNLADDLQTAIANLDSQPFMLTMEDSQGVPHELTLTGTDFHAGMYNALYDVALIPVVPLLIYQAAQGNYSFLVELANQSIPFLTGLAEGARLSYDCVDSGSLIDETALAQAISQYPTYSTLFGANSLAFCELWDVQQAPASYLDAVVSDVPTLLLAGEFDPVTPVTQTELAAASLGNGEFYVFPGFGHGVSRQSPCAETMTREFLRDGAADTSCWSALPTETF